MIKLKYNRFENDQDINVGVNVKADTSSTKSGKKDIDSFKKAIEGLSDPISSLTTAFKNLDYSKLVYMWHTVARVSKSMVNMVSSAAEYEESLNLYTMALGEYAEKASEWSQTLTDKLMLDPSPFMQYMGAFYNFAKGLNVTKDAAYLMSKNLTQLTYDMASYLNISNEAAQAKIQSAMAGQSRAVASVGVAMQVASLQELAYSLGIQKTVKEMTQAEKTYLRYIQLMNSTTQMQGDLGRTMITPANAIRALKNQIAMLGRAIGQVLTPIIMKAIPYIIALSNVLKRAAQSLATFFGYKLSDVDYSSALSFEDAGDGVKNLNAIGGAAKKAGDSVKNSLAPFDELNQVMFESKTAGSGGLGGGIGPIDSSAFDALLPTYDMLKDYNDEFARQAKNLEGKVKGIALLLAGIVGARILGKAIIGISKVLTAFKDLKGFGGAISKSFGDFATKAGFSTEIFAGVATTVAKIAGTIGLAIASFGSAYLITKEWDGSVGDLSSKLSATVVIVGALSVAALALAGPWAAVAVAIAGVTGAVIGLDKAYKEYTLEMEKQAGFPELIDNQGVALSGAYNIIQQGLAGIAEHASVMESLVNSNKEARDTFDETKKSFDEYVAALTNGEITYKTHADLVKGIGAETDKVKQASIDRLDTEKANELQMLDVLKEETGMTEDEYNKRKNAIESYYNMVSAAQNGYYDKYKTLLIQREEGIITEGEFQKKLQDLQKEYLGLTDHTLKATESTKNYLEAQNGKIDLESPEKLKDIIDRTIKSRESALEQEDSSHSASMMYYAEEIRKLEEQKEAIEKTYGAYDTYDEKVKTTYDTINEKLDTTRKNFQDNELNHLDAAEKINATYKNFLATILLELNATGNDEKLTFQNTISDINDEMGKIGSDVDIKKSTTDFFGKYEQQMYMDGTAMSGRLATQFQDWGIKANESYGQGLISSEALNTSKYESYINGKLESAHKNSINPSQYNRAKGLGKNTVDGTIQGLMDEKTALETCVKEDIGYDSIMSPFQKELQIHSPSRVFEEYGIYIVEGLEKGIYESRGTVMNVVDRLAGDLKNSFEKMDLNINVKTNVESSFNQILNKLQKFCDKWRSAINSLASGMKTTMNGIKIDKSGKVTYTSMPKVNVSTFEQGGFPTKGDLFFANENGVPEYITTIGNKTAVANNDQMAQAVSNAILSAMGDYSKQLSKEPSTIIVQIGNEKVYEGQGQYQSRESDRYGTSYVKI